MHQCATIEKPHKITFILTAVREKPLQQIFLPESGKKKGVFPYPKIGGGKWAFNIDKQQGELGNQETKWCHTPPVACYYSPPCVAGGQQRIR
jgi:hypothetical protein